MKIKLKNLKENALMELFSLEGIKVFSNWIEPKSEEVAMPNLAKGYYILRIKNKSSVATMKVVHK